MTTERRVRAMGSDAVVVVVGGPPGLADAAIDRLADLERRWSRFLPDSEVNRANRAGGAWTRVSPETIALVERAELARRRTGGRFDPTCLRQLEQLGYDRSFEQLAAGPAPLHTPPEPRESDSTEVLVDRRSGSIQVPSGVGFDPGGIGKGFAADTVVAELLGEGAGGACISLGGDVRVAGSGPHGDDWLVEVDDPWDPGAAPLVTLRLSDGAVATSSRCRRRWLLADGTEAHHLIDPRTGASARTETLAATAVAAEGWQAEALTKAAFLGPAADAVALLGAADATGLVVTEQGVLRAPDLGRFVQSSVSSRRR